MIEGPRLVAEALDARAPLVEVLLEARCQGPLTERLDDAGVAWQLVADGALDGVGDARTSQGAVAVAEAPPFDRALATLGDLVLVLVGVGDPGNLGTLARVADAAGAGLVVAGRAADVLAPKVVRAGAGATFRVPVAEVASAAGALEELGRLGLRRVGTVPRHGLEPEAVDLAGPAALVVGSEAHGLPPGLDRHLDALATIPMPGRAESLNVAMAATVVTFEALRQRRAGNRLDDRRLAGQGWRP